MASPEEGLAGFAVRYGVDLVVSPLVFCMASEIDKLIERYGMLEQRVRHRMEQSCRHFCAICTTVCCQSHFCIETKESVFLRLVAKRFSPGSAFHPSKGWLSAGGCTLLAGHPPVCYEYSCKKISNSLKNDSIRGQAFATVSMVMTRVGKGAFGRRHLVEALRSADLDRIRSDRLQYRLREAETDFQTAVHVLNSEE
jgi:hypothetical protein